MRITLEIIVVRLQVLWNCWHLSSWADRPVSYLSKSRGPPAGGLSARALTSQSLAQSGGVCPGVRWSWVLNPDLHLKKIREVDHSQRGWGHPPPSGAAPGRGVPTTYLLLCSCVLIFQCLWHGVVAAAAPAPPAAVPSPPWQAWGRGGLCLQRPSDHLAALLLDTRRSHGREGGAAAGQPPWLQD